MIQICNFIGQNKEQGEQQDALDKVKAVLFSCYKNIGVNDQDILYQIASAMAIGQRRIPKK